MNRIVVIFTGLMLLCSAQVLAQSWVELRDNGASFEEIQTSFETEWANKTPEKGQGYNLFRRWENFVEPRVHGGTSWTEMSGYIKSAWEKENQKGIVFEKKKLKVRPQLIVLWYCSIVIY